MQTITLQITNDDALEVLQDLQEKQLISILSQPDLSSVVFPGKPLSTAEFKDWVAQRENSPSIGLEEAKALWAKKKKQLQKLAN